MSATKFTCLPVALPYPPEHRAKLSSLHSSVITYVAEHYSGSFKERRHIIRVLNTISYLVLNHDSFPSTWNQNSPLEGLELVDDDVCKSSIQKLFISEKNILWDVSVVESPDGSDSGISSTTSPDTVATVAKIAPADMDVMDNPFNKASRFVSILSNNTASAKVPTPKEDLYIRPPAVPQFDAKQIYASGTIDGTSFVIYKSLPDIPTRQNEISCTTDVDMMTGQHLRALFPNRIIQTRAASLYTQIEGLDYHPDLGVILPIKGFTQKQLVDNLIRYPHIFQLKKMVDGEMVSFYKTVEVDGELRDIFDIWDVLPDTKKLPKNADFIKEYTVRRYLLERDHKGVQHRYPIHGTLDPFLTLFMPIDDYVRLGYSNIEDIARSCVSARVSYKQSRNPVIRRLTDNA